MSGSIGAEGPGPIASPLDPESWQAAGRGLQLAMPQMVPGYSPDEPWYQKTLDYASLPARMAVNPLIAGGEAYRKWMAGDQGPETQGLLTSSALGLATEGLARPVPGPGAFGAYHGSRHLFEPEPGAPGGRFRNEAIGTGEGAQVKGWGHYVAGKQGTAESYTTAGMDDFGDWTVKVDGEPAKYSDYSNPAARNGLMWFVDHKGDQKAAINALHDEARSLFDRATRTDDPYGPASPAHSLAELSEFRRLDVQDAKEFMESAEWLKNNGHRLEAVAPPEGHLYSVHVHPDEEQLLDWDRPMHQQSPEVRAAVQDLFVNNPVRGAIAKYTSPGTWAQFADYKDHLLGEEVYRRLQAYYGGPKQASEALDAKGVPGLQFLDARSRDLPPGHPDATRNYVLFHPRHMAIVGRDGKHWGLEPVEHDPFGTEGPGDMTP